MYDKTYDKTLYTNLELPSGILGSVHTCLLPDEDAFFSRFRPYLLPGDAPALRDPRLPPSAESDKFALALVVLEFKEHVAAARTPTAEHHGPTPSALLKALLRHFHKQPSRWQQDNVQKAEEFCWQVGAETGRIYYYASVGNYMEVHIVQTIVCFRKLYRWSCREYVPVFFPGEC